MQTGDRFMKQEIQANVNLLSGWDFREPVHQREDYTTSIIDDFEWFSVSPRQQTYDIPKGIYTIDRWSKSKGDEKKWRIPMNLPRVDLFERRSDYERFLFS